MSAYITLAVDGTKIRANASKHSAVSLGHAPEQMRLLEEEIAALLACAAAADRAPLRDGRSIPAEPERSGDSQPQAARRLPAGCPQAARRLPAGRAQRGKSNGARTAWRSSKKQQPSCASEPKNATPWNRRVFEKDAAA
jgi:hypothetical protein